MKAALFIIILLLLCGCRTTDHGPRTTDLPPLPPEMPMRHLARAMLDAPVTVQGTFSVGEGYTPGPLRLDTPHLVSQTDAQFPVDVIVDARNGAVVGRYLNPDLEVYSPITFDGGTDGNAFYLLRARTVNDSILHWTTEFLP